MTTITFDTLTLTEKLSSSGFTQDQAKTIVKTIADAQDTLVTKSDLENALIPIRAELAILKWMMGALLGIGVAVLLRLFT